MRAARLNLARDQLDLDAQPPGHGAGVFRAQRTIADARDDGGDGLQGTDPALGAGQVEPCDGGSHRELEHRHGILDQGADRGISPGLAQLARVLAGCLHGHEGLRGPALILAKSTHGGLLPGRIAVEREDSAARDIALVCEIFALHSRRREVAA